MSQIVYPYKNALYVNLTNRCPCACSYCIKNKWGWLFRGHNLKLTTEPTADEVLRRIGEMAPHPGANGYEEIVFCGYGEPFVRYDVMKETALKLKNDGWTRVRVNTTGLAEASDKIGGGCRPLEALLEGLKGAVDSFSVSMNAADPEFYEMVNRPSRRLFPEGKGKPFYSVIEFVRAAKSKGFDVTITAVNLPGLDVDAVSRMADEIGVKFRLREYLDEYEDR